MRNTVWQKPFLVCNSVEYFLCSIRVYCIALYCKNNFVVNHCGQVSWGIRAQHPFLVTFIRFFYRLIFTWEVIGQFFFMKITLSRNVHDIQPRESHINSLLDIWTKALSIMLKYHIFQVRINTLKCFGSSVRKSHTRINVDAPSLYNILYAFAHGAWKPQRKRDEFNETKRSFNWTRLLCI